MQNLYYILDYPLSDEALIQSIAINDVTISRIKLDNTKIAIKLAYGDQGNYPILDGETVYTEQTLSQVIDNYEWNNNEII